MMLAAGHRLGNYEIGESLGAGGMGIVYRARDTRLGRDVAIKVLPDDLAQNEERLRRFEREARLLASMNHPNIATLHGLEESHGRRFLVMELVEGHTLAERIAWDRLSRDEALSIAVQIARALEAAHAQGIVHRDLKPANVKVTEDGIVKLLDFGLGKAIDPAGSEPRDDSQSPTLTRVGTADGVLLGTAAYMSPEQARGRTADERADVWAFGAVLFEMLTGRRPFEGETVSDTLAAVLKSEPAWDRLPSETPFLLTRLLRRCLQKDRGQRLHAIADARFEIEDHRVELPRTSSNRGLGLVLVGAAALAAGFLLRRPDPPASRFPVRFTLEAPNVNIGRRQVDVSDDGNVLVFGGRFPTVLYRRTMSSGALEPIPGTEGGRHPFLSPDGRWVGFRVGNALRKVLVAGGAAQTLCECAATGAADWAEDGTILFASSSGLMRISADGGEAEPAVPAETRDLLDPILLPGERDVLVTDARGENVTVAVLSLETGEWKPLTSGHSARFLPPGYLLFVRGRYPSGTLFAARFDPEAKELDDHAVPVLDDVLIRGSNTAASFAVSPTGTMVAARNVFAQRRLVWVDRTGRVTPLRDDLDHYNHPRLSPDDSRLAVYIVSPERMGVWVLDLARGSRTRLSEGALAIHPVWAPDGETVTFVYQASQFHVVSRNADGSGPLETLLAREGGQDEPSWSPDGETLFFTDDGRDIWKLSDDKEASPVITSPAEEHDPSLSPDGRYLVYRSDESGQDEIYVTPYPAADRRITISTEGGRDPRWSRDGKELFFVDDDRLMAVDVQTHPEFRAGTPKELFRAAFTRAENWNYDVSKDGRRFVMLEGGTSTTEIEVVLNFDEELRARFDIGNAR